MARLSLRLLVALTGSVSVFPLVIWVYGLASFRHAAIVCGLLGLSAGTAAFIIHRQLDGRQGRENLLRAAVFGGLIGTLLYDLVRIPFIYLFGFRLLSPIESYGVLLLGSTESSPATAFVGWFYHFVNGIGFAVTFAALFRLRTVLTGVLWALILETATLLTPFASIYGISSYPELIVIAYGAHVPYGWAIGWSTGNPGHAAQLQRFLGRGPMWKVLGSVLVVLLLWLSPWTEPIHLDRPASVAVRRGVFDPAFVRTAPGHCVPVVNRDRTGHALQLPSGPIEIPPLGSARLCFPAAGVFRVPAGGRRFDGGFVIVDPTGDTPHRP